MTALSVLIEKMPERYLTLEATVNYIAGNVGYERKIVRETIEVLAGGEIIRLRAAKTAYGQMKQITHNGPENEALLKRRREWVLGLKGEELEFYCEGGLNTRMRAIFERMQREWFYLREKHGWDDDVRKLQGRE